MEFNRIIKLLRKERGITQKQAAEDLPNPEKMKDNVYHGSVLPTMNKKLISNSLNVLYAKIGQCHSKALTTEVSSYLMMAVAKMFRLLYSAEPHNAQSLFGVEARRWPGYSDAVMKMAESNVEALLAGEDVNGGEGVKDPSSLAMTLKRPGRTSFLMTGTSRPFRYWKMNSPISPS